jgi:hypothetical protein
MKRRLAHQAGKGPKIDRSLSGKREKRESQVYFFPCFAFCLSGQVLSSLVRCLVLKRRVLSSSLHLSFALLLFLSLPCFCSCHCLCLSLS